MSSHLLFDIEILDPKEMKWKLVRNGIGVFACHPMREYMRDTEVGYDYVGGDFNEKTQNFFDKSEFGLAPLRIIYLNQIEKLKAEASELIQEDKEFEPVFDAFTGLYWIVRHILEENVISCNVEENIRLIFYIV